MIILNKQKNRDFIVLNLSDPNMSMDEMKQGSKARKIFDGTIDELVKTSSPDLITISGDFSYGEHESCYKTIGEKLDSFNIPWAFVWGNHDNQVKEDTLLKNLKILTSYKNCLFESGDKALGSGNYVIRIDEDGKPVYALIMMDSHDREEYISLSGEKMLCWGRLNKAQLDWLKTTTKSLGVKNTIITHIPLAVYNRAFNKAWNKEYNPKEVTYLQSFDKKYWNEGYKNSFGVCYENICSYPIEDGEFEAVKQSNLTELVLTGHDHSNCFAIPFEGVTLAYALKLGIGCYYSESLNGGTVLRINQKGVSLKHIFIDSKKYDK